MNTCPNEIDSIDNIINDVEIITVIHFSFDYWNTLFDSNVDFKIKRAELIQSTFKIHESLQTITDAFSLIGRRYNNKIEAGGTTKAPIELMKSVLFSLGVYNSKNFQDVYYKSLQIFEENPPKLKDINLKRQLHLLHQLKKSISITSNTAFIPGESLRRCIEKFGFSDLFNFMLFSDEVKCSKPSPTIFGLVFQNAQRFNKTLMTKEQVMHVGDNMRSDFMGAKEYGFKSALMK